MEINVKLIDWLIEYLQNLVSIPVLNTWKMGSNHYGTMLREFVGELITEEPF